MKIAVTGARGFVGGAVAGTLTASGYQVVALARPDWDLLRPDAWQMLPGDTETIIHTAAAFEGQAPEDELWKTNVGALMGLLRRCRELPGLRHLILCSSGAVYAPQPVPVTAQTEPRPTSAYGMSKLLGETMLRHGCAVPVSVLRLFFPFGPGQKQPRLIPRLIRAIREGQPVTLLDAAGAPRINPLPVLRVAACITALVGDAVPAGQTINLGGPVTLSMKALAEKIGMHMGRTPVFAREGSPGPGCLHCEPGAFSGTEEEFEHTLAAAVAAQS